MTEIVLYVAATDADATAGATELERVGTRLSAVPAVDIETIQERAPAADCVVFAETPTTIDGAHLLDVVDACGQTPLVLYTDPEYGPTTARATDGIAGYVRRDDDRAAVHLADEIHWVCHDPEPGTQQQPIPIDPPDSEPHSEPSGSDPGADTPASEPSGNAPTKTGHPVDERIRQAHTQRLAEIERLLAHDLQNQLNLANGYLTIATETGDPSHLENVDSAHDGIETVLDTLLERTRERDLLAREPIGLQDVARCAWARLEERERADRTLDLDGDRVFEADKQRMTDGFEALFRGARPAAGEVTIRVTTQRDGFVVADDGVPPAERGESIEPDGGASESADGLDLVNRIADAHSWSIAVDESDDGGTRVTVTDLGADETTLFSELSEDRPGDRTGHPLERASKRTIGLPDGERTIDPIDDRHSSTE